MIGLVCFQNDTATLSVLSGLPAAIFFAIFFATMLGVISCTYGYTWLRSANISRKTRNNFNKPTILKTIGLALYFRLIVLTLSFKITAVLLEK